MRLVAEAAVSMAELTRVYNPEVVTRMVKERVRSDLALEIYKRHNDEITVERRGDWDLTYRLELDVFTRKELEEYVQWRIEGVKNDKAKNTA